MQDTISIRAALHDDAAALALVGQASFLEAFAGILPKADILAHCAHQHSIETYQNWLRDPEAAIWLASADPGGAPIGYLVLTPPKLPIADPRADDLEIKRIYILHRFQRFGVGKRLMSAAVEHARLKGCRRLLLGVYSRNANAIAFYERVGYRHVGVRKFQVGNNTYDDVVLARDL